MAKGKFITCVVALIASVSTAYAVEFEVERDAFEVALEAARSGNYEAAFTAWLPLAQGGDREAQYNIGLMYRRGDFVAQDDVEAARWFLEAAELGLPIAQCQMGYMFANGYGLSKDLLKGAQWSGLSAKNGSDDGQRMLAAIATELGWSYMGGEESFDYDLVSSCMWFTIGAENGDKHAVSMVDSICGSLEFSGEAGGVEALKARCVRSGYHDCE